MSAAVSSRRNVPAGRRWTWSIQAAPCPSSRTNSSALSSALSSAPLSLGIVSVTVWRLQYGASTVNSASAYTARPDGAGRRPARSRAGPPCANAHTSSSSRSPPRTQTPVCTRPMSRSPLCRASSCDSSPLMATPEVSSQFQCTRPTGCG